MKFSIKVLSFLYITNLYSGFSMNKHYVDGVEYPNGLPMRWTATKGGKVSKGYKHYDHRSKFYEELYTFLDGHIRQNFDVVFKKFCEKFPKHSERYNTRVEFLNAFKEHEFKKASCYEYWVDDNNNIQKGERYKTPRKTVRKYLDDVPKLEVVCPRNLMIRRSRTLQNYIYITLGKDAFDLIMSGQEIPRTQFDALFRDSGNSIHIRNTIEKIAENSLKLYPRWTRAHGTESIFDQLFPKFAYRSYITLYEGTPEYSQYMKEKEDARRKEKRERKKEREEYLDNLLYSIEHKRKLAELSKNIIDRDRLGFDEESFIGEPYHGQKRKKRG